MVFPAKRKAGLAAEAGKACSPRAWELSRRLLLGEESLGWKDALFLSAYLFPFMVYSEKIHTLHRDLREKSC